MSGAGRSPQPQSPAHSLEKRKSMLNRLRSKGKVHKEGKAESKGQTSPDVHRSPLAARRDATVLAGAESPPRVSGEANRPFQATKDNLSASGDVTFVDQISSFGGFLASNLAGSQPARGRPASRGIVAIEVTLLGARSLAPADANGFSDPYVLVTSATLGSSAKSSIRKKTLNPVWGDEKLRLKVPAEVTASDGRTAEPYLRCQVWDWDRFSANEFLGEVTFATLADIPGDDTRPRWYALKARPESERVVGEVQVQGELHLGFRYVRQDTSSAEETALQKLGAMDDETLDDIGKSGDSTKSLMKRFSTIKFDVERILYCIEPLLQLKAFLVRTTRWENPVTTVSLMFLIMYVVWHDVALSAFCLVTAMHFGRVWASKQFGGRSHAFIPVSEMSQSALSRRVKEIKDENRTGRRSGVQEDILMVLMVIGIIADLLQLVRMLENRPLHQQRMLIGGLLVAALFSFFLPVIRVAYYLLSWVLFFGSVVVFCVLPAFSRSLELQAMVKPSVLRGYRDRALDFAAVFVTKMLRVRLTQRILTRLDLGEGSMQLLHASSKLSLAERIEHHSKVHDMFWHRFEGCFGERLLCLGEICDVWFSDDWSDASPLLEATSAPVVCGVPKRCVVYLSPQNLCIFVPPGFVSSESAVVIPITSIRRLEHSESGPVSGKQCQIEVLPVREGQFLVASLDRFVGGDSAFERLFKPLFELWSDVDDGAASNDSKVQEDPLMVPEPLRLSLEGIGMSHVFDQNADLPQDLALGGGHTEPVVYIIQNGFAALSAKGHVFETAVKNQAIGVIGFAGHLDAGLNATHASNDQFEARAMTNTTVLAIPSSRLLATMASDTALALRVVAFAARSLALLLRKVNGLVLDHQKAVGDGVVRVESFPALSMLSGYKRSKPGKSEKTLVDSGSSETADSSETTDEHHGTNSNSRLLLGSRAVWVNSPISFKGHARLFGAVGLYVDRLEFVSAVFGRAIRAVIPFASISRIMKITKAADVFTVVAGDETMKLAIVPLELEGPSVSIWRELKTLWHNWRERPQLNRASVHEGVWQKMPFRQSKKREDENRAILDAPIVLVTHQHKPVNPAPFESKLRETVDSHEPLSESMSLGREAWDALLRRTELRTFRHNEVIMYAGEAAEFITHIVRGQARIVVHGDVVGVVAEGAIVGEGGLLPADPTNLIGEKPWTKTAVTPAAASVIVDSDELVAYTLPIAELSSFFELCGLESRLKFYLFGLGVVGRRFYTSLQQASEVKSVPGQSALRMSSLEAALGGWDGKRLQGSQRRTDSHEPSSRRRSRRSFKQEAGIEQAVASSCLFPDVYRRALEHTGVSRVVAKGDSIKLAKPTEPGALEFILHGSMRLEVTNPSSGMLITVDRHSVDCFLFFEGWLQNFGSGRDVVENSRFVAEEETVVVTCDAITLRETINWTLSVRFFNFLCSVLTKRIRALCLIGSKGGVAKAPHKTHRGVKSLERILGNNLTLDGGFRCSTKLSQKSSSRTVTGWLGIMPQFMLFVGTVFGKSPVKHLLPFSTVQDIHVRSDPAKEAFELVITGKLATGSALKSWAQQHGFGRGIGVIEQSMASIANSEIVYAFRSAETAASACSAARNAWQANTQEAPSLTAVPATVSNSNEALSDEESSVQGEDVNDGESDRFSRYQLTSDDWDKLMCDAEERTFGDGDVIFDVGEELPGIMQVLQGRIRLMRSTSAVKSKDTAVIVEEFAEQDIFGEECMLAGMRSQSKAVALGPTTICVLRNLDQVITDESLGPSLFKQLAFELKSRVTAIQNAFSS